MYWNTFPIKLILYWRNSNMKKFKSYFLVAIVFVTVILAMNTAFWSFLRWKNSLELANLLDEINRQMAIERLCELRGRIFEVQSLLYADDITLDIAQSEISDIIDFQDYDNPYLDNFELTVTESSTGAICDDLISQIDDQIDKIWSND